MLHQACRRDKGQRCDTGKVHTEVFVIFRVAITQREFQRIADLVIKLSKSRDR